jgi:hypothetical protein
MTRFFLTEDGNVARDTPAELPVDFGLPPQLLRFHYEGVIRLAQVVTIKSSGGSGYPSLLLALELWNSRDGLHEEGATKTFRLDRIYGVTNA